MAVARSIWCSGLIAAAATLPGCRYGTECCIEQRASRSACMPADLSPVPAVSPSAVLPAPVEPAPDPRPPVEPLPPGTIGFPPADAEPQPPRDSIASVVAGLDRTRPPRLSESDSLRTVAAILPISFDPPPHRFEIPPELPGADAPPLRVPPIDPDRPLDMERQRAIRDLYDGLPGLVESSLGDGSSGVAMSFTLPDLQQMAVDNSPVLRQAAAEVERLHGLAVQARLYPNPSIGYQADTVNTGDTAGYHGGYLAQEIVTADKLTLAQDALRMEMRAAECNLRKARIALASDVRAGYFDVLIAQERITLTRAIARLTEETYQAQIELVLGGEVAAYEPLQLRVLAMQARNAVLRAENERLSSWRQLAAAMGVPDLPTARLAGAVEAPPPRVDHPSALQYLLTNHSDLGAAEAMIASRNCNLRLQQVTPIPNLDVNTVVQRDYTTPLNSVSWNLQVGMPIPLFNRNSGNIMAAEAQIVGAQQDYADVRNDLVASLAEAYNRYSSSRIVAESYRTSILRDQVQSYRGVYTRFRESGGEVDFAQVVVAQQTLTQVVTDYLDALSTQWDAVVDLAELLQVDDLYSMEMLVGVQPLAMPVEPVPAGDDAPAVNGVDSTSRP